MQVNQKNIIVTSDGHRYQKADTGKVVAGVLVGNFVGGVALKGSQMLAHIPFKNIKNDVAVFNAGGKTSQAIDTALQKSGLLNKGLKFIDATEANSELIKETINKAIPKWLEKVPFVKNVLIKKLKVATNIIKNGKNACFLPKANAIIINKEKMGWAAFHEMGHALNKQSKGAIAVLRRLKGPTAALASVALLTALFKRKKVEGEKPQGAWDKVTTFVKNNCGKIAFLGFVPTLMEEGLASIRGAKLAKATNLFTQQQLKTLSKLHGKAWLTYLGTAVGMGLAAYTVSKIRDHFAKPKQIS